MDNLTINRKAEPVCFERYLNDSRDMEISILREFVESLSIEELAKLCKIIYSSNAK